MEAPKQGRPRDDITRPRANPQGHKNTNSNSKSSTSSRQSSSKDRHAILFNDPRTPSIRAVTPDGLPQGHGIRAQGTSPVTASPSKPSSLRRKNLGSSRDQTGSLSNTDEDTAPDGRRRRAHTRSLSRDDLGPDSSPGSFISKTRKRLGSITNSASAVPKQPQDLPSSIGFPSVVRPPPASPQFAIPRDDWYGGPLPRRAFSPDTALSPLSSAGFRSSTWLSNDSARILHLMKTTCGRMHGILFFRSLHTSAWASGYCSIQVASGSLVYQVKGDVAQAKVLIADLRGCTVRTHYDSEMQTAYLSVLIASSGSGYQFRPSVPETFDSWLAALLCWQPLRPRGFQNKMTKPQPVAITSSKSTSQRRRSAALTGKKSTAAIKVGQSLLWNGPLPSGSQIMTSHHGNVFQSLTEDLGLWCRVTCKLLEDGTFKLLSEEEPSASASMSLSELVRCAVQRFDASLLNMEYCIAIYPQYTVSGPATGHKRPTILSFESRPTFEAWFVLLRALTVPEFYGPERQPTEPLSDDGPQSTQQDLSGMFRVERRITVRIVEASFTSMPESLHTESVKPNTKSTTPVRPPAADVYADIFCGQDLRARTSMKPCESPVFWASDFVFDDLPSVLSDVAVVVRIGNPGEQEWTMVAHGPYDLSGDASYLSGLGGLEISSHDAILGKVYIPVDELEQHGSIEKRWPILDLNDRPVGYMLMRITLQESVVLMSDEYSRLSSMLDNFTSSLTPQLSQVLGSELKQLSDLLLDIYQAGDHVYEWLCMLIEEEIDGIYRETPPHRVRFSARLQSNDSYDSPEHRELIVRDLSRSATVEANLLFRGNSLVTKALDAHMRRLGGDYLQLVLGKTIRAIVRRDPDCEVDPTRVKSSEQLERNWVNLLQWTSAIWRDISRSASQCPAGLRLLFKHIRSCAEDRYGSFIRTVKYTSVSGFLFLRFFCPAILNPKLFGLLPEHVVDGTKRTFTLIAKSLNTLANMTRFGTKETWMEPMNKFLAASTNEFKLFIDNICAISSSQLTSASLEPQYAAPTQIKGRLPTTSREGLPSLPYLLDHTKFLADLAALWVTHAPDPLPDTADMALLQEFSSLCFDLHNRGKKRLLSAEQAEKPDSKLEPKWQQILSEQQHHPNIFDENFASAANDPDLTALPQPLDSAYAEARTETNITEAITTLPTPTSPPWEGRRLNIDRQAETTQRVMTSSNSSNTSLDLVEEKPIALPSSRDGPATKNRLFELMGSTARRKAKAGHGHDEGTSYDRAT
ncbi:hypothetical protein DV738_g1449, partial [Chaetothyriales sp. CBS 135597]